MTAARHTPGALPVNLAEDPFVRSKLRRAALGLLCIKIALLPIIFDRTVDVPFTVTKTLFSHASAYLLVAMLAGLAVRFPASFPWRTPLNAAVVAYIAVNIAATVVAEDRYLALFGAHERMLGLGTLLDFFVLYLAVAYLVRGRRDLTAVALTFFAGATVVMAYELVQLTGLDPLSWSGATRVRPSSTIGQANSLAEYLVVVAAAAAAIALLVPRLRRSVSALLAFGVVLALEGAALTQTRSVLLGVAGLEVALIALVWARHPSGAARARYVAGTVAIGVALAGILALSPLGSRVATTVEFEAPTAEGEEAAPRVEAAADVRLALYRISLRMLLERPVLGYGPDNFLAALPNHRSDSEPYEVQANANSSAHSWVAQVATSSGLLGLLTFTAIAAVAGWMALRRPEPAAAVGAAMMSAFLAQGLTTINEISTDWLFWGAAGLVASTSIPLTRAVAPPATSRHRKRELVRGASSQDRARLAAAAVFIGLGAALAGTTFGALDASRANHASRAARFAGRTSEAIERGRHATRTDAGRPEYWHVLGLAYVAADRFRDALAVFEEADRLSPYEVSVGSSYAKALLVLGQRGDARAMARARDVADRLVRTDPNSPIAHVTRAVVMHGSNDLEKAIVSVHRAVALDRTSPSGQTALRDTYVTGVQVLSAAGRRPEAIALADLGISRLPIPNTQVPVRIERARALAAGGNFDEALREIDTALAIQPRSTAAQQLRAQIEAARPR